MKEIEKSIDDLLTALAEEGLLRVVDVSLEQLKFIQDISDKACSEINHGIRVKMTNLEKSMRGEPKFNVTCADCLELVPLYGPGGHGCLKGSLK